MIKLEMDQDLVAVLSPEEVQLLTGKSLTEMRDFDPTNFDGIQLRMLAAMAANKAKAKSLGIPVERLESSERFNWKKKVDDDAVVYDPATEQKASEYVGQEILVDTKEPGSYPVFRGVEPDAPNVIRSRNMKTGDIEFHMVADPALWKMLQYVPNPNGTVSNVANNVARFFSGASAPLKQTITSSLTFAARNVFRDMVTMEMLREDDRAFAAGSAHFNATKDMINSYREAWLSGTKMAFGESIGDDAIARELNNLVEEMSEAYDPQMRVAPHERRGEVDLKQKFFSDIMTILQQNIMLKGYRDMPNLEKFIQLPRQVSGTATLLSDFANYVTMGRRMSQVTEMAPRLQAYKHSRLQGDSPERAIMAHDSASGLFIQRGGNEVLANYISSIGFINPAIQIMYGVNKRAFKHWDPQVKFNSFVMRQGILAGVAASGALLNLALIKLMYGDEAEDIFDEMRERSAKERAENISLLGFIRLPLDDGPGGSSVSLAVNLAESLVLNADDTGEVLDKIIISFIKGTVSPVASNDPEDSMLNPMTWVNPY